MERMYSKNGSVAQRHFRTPPTENLVGTGYKGETGVTPIPIPSEIPKRVTRDGNEETPTCATLNEETSLLGVNGLWSSVSTDFWFFVYVLTVIFLRPLPLEPTVLKVLVTEIYLIYVKVWFKDSSVVGL